VAGQAKADQAATLAAAVAVLAAVAAVLVATLAAVLVAAVAAVLVATLAAAVTAAADRVTNRLRRSFDFAQACSELVESDGEQFGPELTAEGPVEPFGVPCSILDILSWIPHLLWNPVFVIARIASQAVAISIRHWIFDIHYSRPCP
jgi:hypothetical protein